MSLAEQARALRQSIKPEVLTELVRQEVGGSPLPGQGSKFEPRTTVDENSGHSFTEGGTVISTKRVRPNVYTEGPVDYSGLIGTRWERCGGGGTVEHCLPNSEILVINPDGDGPTFTIDADEFITTWDRITEGSE